MAEAKKPSAKPSAPSPVAIEPVEGFYINGIEHVAQVVDAELAAAYVGSGAFRYAHGPQGAAPAPAGNPDAPADGDAAHGPSAAATQAAAE